MFTRRRPTFESLESRRALAVTATVTDGDLIISGDADGAVEIVAVGDGSYQVTDNGVLIADETTLTGVTDDIRVDIDESAAADNAVVVDLSAQTTQTVDQIYADLGDGNNTLQLVGGTAANLNFRGGDGADSVDIGTTLTENANVRLGDGENTLIVNAEVGGLRVRGGDGSDAVTVAAAVAGNVYANLGDGDNSFTLESTVEGNLRISAGDDLDTVTLAEASSVDGNVKMFLGDGDNTATLAGFIGGSLMYEGLDGDDILTTEATAEITDSVFARLGAGNNTFTHNGTINGDLNVVSRNAEDTVTIAETAVVGGVQNIGLGEQTDGRGRGHCGGNSLAGLHSSNSTNIVSSFEAAAARARRR